jgi:hypothetical protein
MSFDFNYRTNSENIVAPDRTVVILAEVLKSILERSGAEIPEYLSTIKVDDVAKCVADKLLASNNSVIILGEHAINNPQAASIAKLIREIAQQTGAATLNVSATSNSIAAEMANFVPGQGGFACSPKIITELFDTNNLSAIHFATSSTLIVLRYSGISAPERSAEMANFVPGQGGLNANAMLAADLSAYILLEVYPQYDFHDWKFHW